MSAEIEFLIATTNRTNLAFLQTMNVQGKAIVVNQCNRYAVEERGNCAMLTTPTKGVGINRNLALSLARADYSFISDDDMVYYENVQDVIDRAIQTHPNADVIIFNFDYYKNGEFVRHRMKKSERISYLNCLNYGICCTLIKNDAIRKKNISFSTLFGGGCKYSCGEDSLFFLDCVRNGLKVYSYIEPVGKNEYRESTWFKGYNEKFFFDKGAWVACAFGKWRHLFKWYFVFRLKSFSELSLKSIVYQVNAGIKEFDAS